LSTKNCNGGYHGAPFFNGKKKWPCLSCKKEIDCAEHVDLMTFRKNSPGDKMSKESKQLIALGTNVLVEEISSAPDPKVDGFITVNDDDDGKYSKGVVKSVGSLIGAEFLIKVGSTIVYLKDKACVVGFEFSDKLKLVNIEDVGGVIEEINVT